MMLSNETGDIISVVGLRGHYVSVLPMKWLNLQKQ